MPLICGAASWRLYACIRCSQQICILISFCTFSSCGQCTVLQRLHGSLCVATCLKPQPVPCVLGAGTALVLALHQAMSAARPLSTCAALQAYELLRIDMPAQEAELAAAALPGLLDVARTQWTRRNEDNTDVRYYPACTAALLDAPWQPVRVLRSSQCLAVWKILGMLEHT